MAGRLRNVQEKVPDRDRKFPAVDNSYEFTAIRGVQAGAAYYVIMVPLKLVARLFRYDDEAIPADLRAQRTLNRARVPAIARYIVQNPEEYILSSLCASIDGEMQFVAADDEGALRSVGRLKIGMDATILINDGQHRRAAIEEAVRDNGQLGNETISVVVFADRGLKRSQQMFADLNMHAVRPSNSIRLLYDHRDMMAGLVRDLVDAVPLFRDFTDLENVSISNRSLKLVTLSSLEQATAALLRKRRNAAVDAADHDMARRYWQAVIDNMPDWKRVMSREVGASELRRDYVHAHGLALQALGVAGAQLVASAPSDWEGRLVALRELDWSRSNRTLWEGRAYHANRMSRGRHNVLLVANVILKTLGVPLPPENEKIETLAIPAVPLRKAS